MSTSDSPSPSGAAPVGTAPASDTGSSQEGRLALVTGATGYVGGEVTGELLRRGWRVRTLSRSREKAQRMSWGGAVVAEGQSAGPGEVEVLEGDASSSEDLLRALRDVDTAWYLLHSMNTGDGFQEEEREMAQSFARAASTAGIRRIVYLGGLHPSPEELGGEELSDHLSSRVEVGEILMSSGVPTAALQAGVVLGDGSSSFSMLRHLAERLPAAGGPSWIRNRITPVSIRDAVHYLVGAADLPDSENRTFDIGGPEDIAYADMLSRYARAVGLHSRPMATAPVATPRLAAQWIGLTTPVAAPLAVPLIGSLVHDTVVSERDIDGLIGPPPGGHDTFEDAVKAATRTLDTRRWHRTIAGTALAVGACAALGSAFTKPDSAWYRGLRKPSWQPPARAFPLVWSALYADIAVMSALVLADAREEGDDDEARSYTVALGVNLALNAAWSGLFFRNRRPALATVEAVLLAASSTDLVRRAWASAPQRGVLLAPYAAWTGFASVLSGTIARLNRRR